MSELTKRRRNQRRRARISYALYSDHKPSAARRRRWEKKADSLVRDRYLNLAHDGFTGVDFVCHADINVNDLPPSEWDLIPSLDWRRA